MGRVGVRRDGGHPRQRAAHTRYIRAQGLHEPPERADR